MKMVMDEALEKQLTALVNELLSRPHIDRLAALNFLTQGLLRGSQQPYDTPFPVPTPVKTPTTERKADAAGDIKSSEGYSEHNTTDTST